MKHQIKEHLPVILIFTVFLIVGFFIFDDFGISWDEYYHRINGLVALNFVREMFALEIYPGIQHGTNIEFNESTKSYGVIFDLPMAIIEKFFNINDSHIYFKIRHFFNFLIFYISSIFFYLLLRLRFNKSLSIIGIIFFILSPRIFADSYYNMKDLVFLSFFTLSLYFGVKFLNKPTYSNALLASITSAVSIDVRILGIIVPFIIIFFSMISFLDNKKIFKESFKKLALFTFLLCFFVVLFWPFLWLDPLNNFITSIKLLSAYPMRLSVFYFGDYISSTNLPWHYPIVWIFITTPITYLSFFILGSILIFYKFSKRFIQLSNKAGYTDPWHGNSERMDIIFFLIFYFTIFLVIQLNSTLYGGWRHLYFIYPCLILISVRGLEYVSKFFKFKYLIYLIMPFIIYTFIWMSKNHPYQYVYFNALVNNIDKKFELDYWGTSNKDTLTFIVKHDNSKKINIFVNSVSEYYFSSLMLTEKDKKRLNFVDDISKADYLVTNHYYQKGNPVKINEDLKKKYKLLNQVTVDNLAINSVYKIN